MRRITKIIRPLTMIELKYLTDKYEFIYVDKNLIKVNLKNTHNRSFVYQIGQPLLLNFTAPGSTRASCRPLEMAIDFFVKYEGQYNLVVIHNIFAQKIKNDTINDESDMLFMYEKIKIEFFQKFGKILTN